MPRRSSKYFLKESIHCQVVLLAHPNNENDKSYSNSNIFFKHCSGDKRKKEMHMQTKNLQTQAPTKSLQMKYSFKEFIKGHILKSCNPSALNSAKIAM